MTLMPAEHIPECNPGCDETGHLLLGDEDGVEIPLEES